MFRLALAVSVALASSASAVELRPIAVRTGTEGLTRLPLTVTNADREAIACHAEVAHWYSLELATVAPGASAEIELWRDPATGTLAALNDKRENLPVERLWCGEVGRAYMTRAQIVLDTAAAEPHVACRAGSERIVCD
ncbi:hypothetical protein [Kumtagia ephedrae]|uniref:Uncharacterized protein n=1 Tax=Kumtagia ephedrae TaxID=2116701 RepID=A0A2P7SLP0_9HYPH|nr:hypothetical protein [Mesorhizobium ephedrae]PSJ63295.1 hypothetical protein C7I84_06555 [Mesorhizobium ephedrae]